MIFNIRHRGLRTHCAGSSSAQPKSSTNISTPEEIARLVQGIQASDHNAYTALYDLLYKDLLQYAWHLTHNEAAIYDLVQEAFIVLWDKRKTLDSQQSVRALLFRIVRNNAYKAHRKKQTEIKHAPLPAENLENEGPELYDAEILQNKLQGILEDMSPRRREVFEMSRLGYLKHQEIAESLGITPKTVRNHLVAALQQIRNHLERFYPGQSSS